MSVRSVAVVGAGVGGLTAAGLLARAGHAVTLFEAAAVPGGKAQRWEGEGVVLDTGPTLLTMPGRVRAIFEALGAIDLLPQLTELALHCEYRYRDGARFFAHRSLEESVASAEALSAGEGVRLACFYQEAEAIHGAAGEPYLEAPYEGMAAFVGRVLGRGARSALRGLQLSTLDGLARRHFRSGELRQFAGRFATYAGASPFKASAAFASIAHLERAEGVHHVQGGMAELSRALARAATRQGATLRYGTPAIWRSEGDGFRVGPRQAEERFDALVLNVDPLATLGRSREPLALSGYVLLLTAPGRPRLGHHTILFSADAHAEFADLFAAPGRVPDDPTLYVCFPSATDGSMSSSERSGLFVLINAPPLTPGQRFGEQAARLRELCLTRLGEQWPELKGRLTVCAERTPEDFARQGAPGGSLYGFLPHGRLGPFRRPRLRGPVPGLFFAGGGTHPGGGVPLAMLSGVFAAQLAGEHLAREVRS